MIKPSRATPANIVSFCDFVYGELWRELFTRASFLVGQNRKQGDYSVFHLGIQE
jgi:hypothetical protein